MWSYMGNGKGSVSVTCFLHFGAYELVMDQVEFRRRDLALEAFESGWIFLFGLMRRLCMERWFDGWNTVLSNYIDSPQFQSS